MKPGTKRVSKRWRSGLGWSVLALVGLAMLAWAVSGMRGPSSVRRAALAQLSPPPLGDHNASFRIRGGSAATAEGLGAAASP